MSLSLSAGYVVSCDSLLQRLMQRTRQRRASASPQACAPCAMTAVAPCARLRRITARKESVAAFAACHLRGAACAQCRGRFLRRAERVT